MSGLSFKATGFTETVKVLAKVGQLPQRTVSKAAGKGATVVKRTIKNGTVPVGATGNLKRAIVRQGERSSRKGKKVFDITFDRGMNDVLQKPIKNPGEAGGKNDHAYYPASMEFGFLTRSKGGGLSYVPGYHFMESGGEQASAAAKQTIIDTLSDEIDKEWGK